MAGSVSKTIRRSGGPVLISVTLIVDRLQSSARLLTLALKRMSLGTKIALLG
jgi:hypothetical protein